MLEKAFGKQTDSVRLVSHSAVARSECGESHGSNLLLMVRPPALAVRASNTPWKIREQSRVHPCLRGLGNTSGYSQARDLLAHQTIRTNLFCQHDRLFSSAVIGFKIYSILIIDF